MKRTALIVAILLLLALAFIGYTGPDMALHFQQLLRACGF